MHWKDRDGQARGPTQLSKLEGMEQEVPNVEGEVEAQEAGNTPLLGLVHMHVHARPHVRGR